MVWIKAKHDDKTYLVNPMRASHFRLEKFCSDDNYGIIVTTDGDEFVIGEYETLADAEKVLRQIEKHVLFDVWEIGK